MKTTQMFLTGLFLCLVLISPMQTKDEGKKTTMKIKLTSVFVHNTEEAFKFYTEILGFIEKMHVPEAYLAIVASPEDPDGTELLLEPNGNPIAKTYQEGIYKSGLPVIVFGVEDIYGEYDRLKKLGVVFKQEPTERDWGIDAIFDDTCGNFIMLLQAKK
jgi:catechol 2,3-dioxygenase-like lactoylglutathione lyase family enzyme